MYCGKCNMREVASNPYGIDVCPDCSRAETDKLDTERIGNEYTINIYEQRIAELEAQNAELKRSANLEAEKFMDAYTKLEAQLAQAEAVQRVLETALDELTEYDEDYLAQVMERAKEQVHETSVSADKEEQS